MRTITSLCLTLLFTGSMLSANAQQPTANKDAYHVMWTSKKGEAKCKDKNAKEKAEKCATKLRTKEATNVQVMAGHCAM